MRNIKTIKIFNSKQQFDISSSALIILFNEYVKDKNKAPLINLVKLEKTYLNPSFKIHDLIKDNEFYEALFENKNLKKLLFSKYYSINQYKLIVDNRYNLLRNLDDKIDYSYQINILDLLPNYGKEILKYSNSSIKNNIKRKKIYIKQKKNLFTWNGFWSNRELFYGDTKSNIIKYKVINHYTSNLMRPLIAPILDINYYLPQFTEFNKDNLFNKKENLNNNDSFSCKCDLTLDIDKIFKLSNSKNGNSISNKKNIVDDENKINDNININSFINDNEKKMNDGLLKNDNESNTNYLAQIYQKSNPKLYKLIKKISNKVDFNKEQVLEEEIEEEPIKKECPDKDKENDDDISDENKSKTNNRKDTLESHTTSSSTIKKENLENSLEFKNDYADLAYDKDTSKIKKEEILNNKEYFICCLVKPSHHIKGFIYIREKKFNFKVFSNQKKGSYINGIQGFGFSEKDDDYDKERGTCFGSIFKYHPKDKNLYKLSIIFKDIKWILKRKYYYKNSALELFTLQNKSYYFNFKDEESQIIFLNELIKKIGDCLMIVNDIKESPSTSYAKNNIDMNIIGYQNNSNPFIKKNCKFKMKKIIKLSKIVNQWKNWEISNFDLLILLNLFANRSYNDISQYPVFPWLLINYVDPLKTQQIPEKENEPEKDKKNLKETENEDNKIKEDYTYRDLSTQMGMLTFNEDCIKRKKNYLTSYKIIKQEGILKPYIFGCNYSNPTYVCNYLIRLFPFTHISIEIQGSGFDSPSRLFVSIEKAFKNATSQTTDIRELIPEFFFLPEIFINLNNLNMGFLDTNKPVNDVITPCNNNPYKFISIMRNILENEHISYTINNWIDLIFGYKAKGKEAENAKNLYTEQSYQEDININEIKDKENYLRYGEFGLIPNQLFNVKEFPKREKIEDVKKYKQIVDSFNLRKSKCKKSSNNAVKQTDDLLLLAVNHNYQDKLFFLYKNYLYIEEKISDSLFDKEYSEEIIDVKYISKTFNKITNYYLPEMNNFKNIKIIHDGKIIIIGGYYDGKIIIIDSENNMNTATEIFPFKDESQITTVYADKDEEFLYIGNSFGNITIISIESNNITEWKILNLINDHLNSIISIDSNNQLNIWASASIDGCINIYTLPLYKLTKSFKIPSTNTINYIYICDSPLASIIIICKDEIYLYSINGYKIYYQKENSDIISPIVIKDFNGNNYLAYILNCKEILIKTIPDFSIQKKFENDTEIYYLCPGTDMKLLYAINKVGTQIDVIISDTKKNLEEN